MERNNKVPGAFYRLGTFHSPLFAALFLLAAPAAALDVPPDHPRIFFTKAEVPQLKAHCGGACHAKADRSPRGIIREHGFAYVISGDAQDASRAVQAAVKLCRPELGKKPNDDFEDLFDIAICYDWCYPALGPAKDALARTLAHAMEAYRYTKAMDRGPGHNMTTENSLGALAAGLALYGEHPHAAQWLLDARRVVVDQAMSAHLDRLCPDGDDFEGTQYHGARYQGEGIFAWLWLKGTGENLFTREHPHLVHGVNWWIYILEPHLQGVHLVQGDTNHRGISDRNVTAAACLSLGAGDPYAGWYAAQRLSGWQSVALRPHAVRPPGEGLPPYKFFRPGMAVIRSGWQIGPGSSDTLFTFLCRDYMQGWHCHQDVNHFSISRKGELAIDSGVYKGNGEHSRNYNRRTIAHNSILVYDPAEPLPAGVTARDGGQVFHNDSGFLRRTSAAEIGWKTYRRCEFRAFGVGDGYYYMCGDGSKAYNYADFRKVEHFTREVVYVGQVDPPLIVVFDRVVASKPSSKKTWLLHTIQKPQVAGTTVTVREAEGQLTVQALLPNSPVISAVGGPGRQYWVADPGENYSAGGDADDQGWRGNWRIELMPATPSAGDLFLVVLYPCDPGAAPPAAKLLESQGRAGCEVAVAGKNYKILFNTSGPTGGSFNAAPLAVTDPNQTSR
jgi:heparin/heparan-sulfate lyase